MPQKRAGLKRGFEDDEDDAVDDAAAKRRAVGGGGDEEEVDAEADERDVLDGDEEPEDEIVDDDFEDDDDEMGGDYNAEQYFDAGDDEFGEDGFGDGEVEGMRRLIDIEIPLLASWLNDSAERIHLNFFISTIPILRHLDPLAFGVYCVHVGDVGPG